MSNTEQETIENSQEFKRILGEAFSSMPDRMPGAALVGKYFTMSGTTPQDKESSRKLAEVMVEDMKQHSTEEIEHSIAFIGTLTGALRMLNIAFLIELAGKKNPRRN